MGKVCLPSCRIAMSCSVYLSAFLWLRLLYTICKYHAMVDVCATINCHERTLHVKAHAITRQVCDQSKS